MSILAAGTHGFVFLVKGDDNGAVGCESVSSPLLSLQKLVTFTTDKSIPIETAKHTAALRGTTNLLIIVKSSQCKKVSVKPEKMGFQISSTRNINSEYTKKRKWFSYLIAFRLLLEIYNEP